MELSILSVQVINNDNDNSNDYLVGFLENATETMIVNGIFKRAQ